MTTRWAVKIRCVACGHKYRRVLTAPDEETLATVPDPPCPSCLKRANTQEMVFGTGKAPAVGGSQVTRAVDATAEIVMEDYGMTNLRDDSREGESAAPKLAPRLQDMADNMFTRRPARGAPGLMNMNPRSVMSAAVNGRFNTPDTVNPIAIQHARKDKPPVRIIAGDGMKPAR